MANYSLVINSKFQPFSFERYMQPLQIYAQLYDQERAAMEQQAAQYGLLSNMVDPELDKDVYDAMQKYNENLMKQRDILSTVGLTPQGRRDLSALRQQYFTDVAPVQNWITMRNADIERKNNLYTQTSGNVVFSKDSENPSLSYYKKGKPMDLAPVNLNTVMAEASAEIQALSKRRIEQGMQDVGDYVYFYKNTGWKDVTDADALMSIPEAKEIINRTLEKYGYTSDKYSDFDKQRIYNAAMQGAIAGVHYDETRQYQQDWRDKDELNFAQNVALENLKQEHAKEIAGIKAGNGDGNGDEIMEGQNYLVQSGDYAKYTGLADELTLGKVLNTNYFAGTAYVGSDRKEDKNGKDRRDRAWVNPIVVYDDYSKEKSKIEKKYSRYIGDAPVDFTSMQKELQKLTSNIKSKYGVTKILTPSEYDTLKALGYSSKSTKNDYNDIYNVVNRKATEYSHKSVLLPSSAMKVINDRLTGNISNAYKDGRQGAVLWNIKPDGSEGDVVKDLSDAGLSDFKNKNKVPDYNLTDIMYSSQNPTKIHIVYGGRNFYASPSLLGSTADRLVKEASEVLKQKGSSLKKMAELFLSNRYEGVDLSRSSDGEIRDIVTDEVTRDLINIARSFNKGFSTTDKELE